MDLLSNFISGMAGVLFTICWDSLNKKAYFSREVICSSQNGTNPYPYLILTNVGNRNATYLEVSGFIKKGDLEIPLFDKYRKKIMFTINIPPQTNVALRFNKLFDELMSSKEINIVTITLKYKYNFGPFGRCSTETIKFKLDKHALYNLNNAIIYDIEVVKSLD